MAALLIVCGYVTHSGPACGSGQPQAHSGPGAPVPVLQSRMSPAWFLNRTRRLLNDGRAAEAHELARVGLDLYPHSNELRPGAAFAAMHTGRCQLAMRNLDTLRNKVVAPAFRRSAAQMRAACQGPWRWQALIGATAGYRASLVDR